MEGPNFNNSKIKYFC